MAVDKMPPLHVSIKMIAFRALAAIILTAYAALCVWLLRVPASISSDDAFFFASSLTRFSILDFSPHFPGYPVFVGLGRAVHRWVSDPVEALTRTSTLTALFIPVGLAGVVWRWTRSLPAVVFALALGASLPLLPALALSGLSDGTGLLFFLIFFACLPLGSEGANRAGDNTLWWLVAGIGLGLAICSRPSYGPILAAACAPLLIVRPMSTAILVLGIALVAMPALAVLFAVEGWNYVLEGRRFFEGHLYGWGNTAFSERPGENWFAVLQRPPLIGALVVIYLTAGGALLALRSVRLMDVAVLISFVVALAWTLIMQNPENLRHLAPIMLLGSMLISRLAAQNGLGLVLASAALCVNVVVLAGAIRGHDRPSPLQEAADAINGQSAEALVFSRHGVRFLRDQLQTARVYDLALPAAALAALQASGGRIYRISSSPVDQCVRNQASNKRFPGRVLGETGLWLVHLETSTLPNACQTAIVE